MSRKPRRHPRLRACGARGSASASRHDEKKPVLSDVAARAGVSMMTASRALRGRQRCRTEPAKRSCRPRASWAMCRIASPGRCRRMPRTWSAWWCPRWKASFFSQGAVGHLGRTRGLAAQALRGGSRDTIWTKRPR
ncbi:LacI family DNA-binding transcriptional regulator [Jhaorihella thermophila]